MELFFLNYDFKEEMKEIKYSWQEILFALDNKIITAEDVIEYACYIINDRSEGFDIIMDIVCLDNGDDIYPHLHELIKLEEPQDIKDIKDKWLYLILKWLYENRNDIENVLEIVEEIYELFDFPESISSFVRYLPSEDGDLGSIELNRNRLFRNWDNYLELFKETYLSGYAAIR